MSAFPASATAGVAPASATAPAGTEAYCTALVKLRRRIDGADAVLVGAGSGLSSAAGYNHYHWAPYFAETLAPFRERYGFKSPFDGFYHLFSDYETQWGYYAAYIKAMQDAPTGAPYEALARILGAKPFHVLTTNIDGQCQRVFPASSITLFQGDFGYLQCCQPCCDELHGDRQLVDTLTANLDEWLAVPTEMVPRCAHCGRVMVPWVRDDTFLEGEAWKAGVGRYQDFLDQWADGHHRLLLLELGVGEMTPGVIKLPFWALAQKVPGTFYASVNLSPTKAPLHLAENSLAVNGDLAEILADLANLSALA